MKKSNKVWRIVFIALIVISVILSVFVYQNSMKRTSSAFKDIGYSIYEYTVSMLNRDAEIQNPIKDLPEVDLMSLIRIDVDQFKDMMFRLPGALIDKINILNYLIFVFDLIYQAAYMLMLVIPVVILSYELIKQDQLSERDPKDKNKDSKPLKIFKKIFEPVIRAVKLCVKTLKEYIKKEKSLLIILISVWTVNLNIVTIAIELMAYYIHFATVFDLTEIPVQIVKLTIDLLLMFTGAPFFFWIALLIAFFQLIRKYYALQILEENEEHNKKIIKSLPIVKMNIGDMGRKKTTILVDMSLSDEEIQRVEAYERIKKIELRYPDFPFINLEKQLKKAIDDHKVFNLASCKKWIREKEERFSKYECRRNIFGYRYKDYRMYYDDDLVFNSIWKDLSTYAQLYLIYIVSNTILIGNLSIRQEDNLEDKGHFPERKYEYFDCKSAGKSKSHYSHILDFDMLRLGKKVIWNNPHIGSFEYGVVQITEVGKERGNALENQGLKKDAAEANPKNDETDAFIKLIRHSSTVDNHPFASLYVDEQRAESWGANARELAKIINILSADDERLSYPFYSLEAELVKRAVKRYKEFYSEYRKLRSDNTLISYLYRKIISKVYEYDLKINNKYGYIKCDLQIESGKLDDKEASETVNYYLSKKKIYSNRFSTDCYAGFYNETALASGIGIDDINEYKSVRATFEELKQQNSYLINSMSKYNRTVQKGDDVLRFGKKRSSGSSQ